MHTTKRKISSLQRRILGTIILIQKHKEDKSFEDKNVYWVEVWQSLSDKYTKKQIIKNSNRLQKFGIIKAEQLDKKVKLTILI